MPKRADNGDGSCRQIEGGKHAGKWRVQYIETDQFGRKRRLSKLFPTKAEGKDYLRRLYRHDRAACVAAEEGPTLAEWFDWLAENDWPESLSDNTIGLRICHFNKHVRPVLGHIRLAKIDSLQVRAFYRALRDSGVGPSTLHGVKRELVRTYNQAISPYGRVPSNRANPFCLTLSRAAPRSAVALTPEAARKALAPGRLDASRRALLGVLLLAGLRLGEMMALTRGQVQFGKGLILVDRSVKFDRKGAQSVGLPKGGKIRHAVMCEELESALKDLAARLAPGDYLWPAACGNQPRMKKLVYATWRTVLKDAGLPSDMSPHDCRLTHINWIEKLLPDVSRTTLKEHVGHAMDGVTETNYTRPLSDSQKVLRDGLDGLARGTKRSRGRGRAA